MKTPILLPVFASALLLAGCQSQETTMKPGRPPAPVPTATDMPTPPPAPSAAVATVNLTGDWNWTCCDGHYHGTMTLKQDGGKLSGRLYDDGDTTGGTVDGAVTGNKVTFTRNWGDNSSQDYTLTVSGDGKKLTGDLSGTRDEAVGSNFEATPK